PQQDRPGRFDVHACMDTKGNPPDAQYRRFEGMREYEQLIDELIPQTQRVIRVFEKALAPTWNTRHRQELLRHFLLGDRLNRLYIVVHGARPSGRSSPRLVERVRQFGSAVRIHQPLTLARHVYDPFIVFDSSHYL